MIKYFNCLKIILTIFFFLSIQTNNKLLADQAFIAIKVNNEIITNKDIEKEYRYLIALNNQLKSLEKKQIVGLAKDSIIKETIKKNELKKYYKLNQENEYIDVLFKNFYQRLNIKSEEDFKNYLNQYGLSSKELKKKLEIESIWNEFIYNKYRKQVDINIDNIKKKLNEEIRLKKEKNYSYLLSEILFNLDSNEEKNEKFKVIKEKIQELGFKNSSNIYSVSETAKFGGEIGWVEENKLSNLIKKEIVNLKIGEFTKPINVPNGYLIIKVDNKKIVKLNYNFDKELEKRIMIEKDRQLNQFSSMFYEKIKQNSAIYEK